MAGMDLTVMQKRLLNHFYRKSPSNLHEILSSLKSRQCSRKVLSSIRLLEQQGYIKSSKQSQPEDGVYNIWYEITERGKGNIEKWQGIET